MVYRHVIYRWKALDLNFKDMKRGGAPLLEVRPYWGIYGSHIYSINWPQKNVDGSYIIKQLAPPWPVILCTNDIILSGYMITELMSISDFPLL